VCSSICVLFISRAQEVGKGSISQQIDLQEEFLSAFNRFFHYTILSRTIWPFYNVTYRKKPIVWIMHRLKSKRRLEKLLNNLAPTGVISGESGDNSGIGKIKRKMLLLVQMFTEPLCLCIR
jgi:hypothetical protein